MSGHESGIAVSPFPPEYRASGILLHVTSLPSPYGIGDVGPVPRAWIDRLHDAGQAWWQALPLGPTGYANSPYQPASSFAGNWLLISPDDLLADGLLRESDMVGPSFSADVVEYDAVVSFKKHLVETVWGNMCAAARADLRPAFEQFCNDQAHWLDDYALFRAPKWSHGDAHYLNWPAELVQRNPKVLAQAQGELAQQIDEVRLAQFLLWRQSENLREHAVAKGVSLIGDLPFYVSPDSCDVWANPQLFLVDERHVPRFVAGVPPDYFSSEGQHWGNPVYDWDALCRTGYRWWLDRVRELLAHVDLIRLDHFRGFAAAWHIPAGAPTAKFGEWVPGPGVDLFATVQTQLGTLPFIAEDLGLITPDVAALRDELRVPGTRVLQFAFDGAADNPYLPGNYVPNTVVYTGTHDNNTTRGWYAELTDQQRQVVWRYLNRRRVTRTKLPKS